MSDRNKVIVVGSGGHAKVIIDILESMDQYEIVGATSYDKDQREVSGYKILGDDSVLPDYLKKGITNAFIAIGDNKIRHDAFNKLELIGYSFVNAISPHAIISPKVKLGNGIAVMPGAIINVDSIIGDNAIINTGASLDHDNIIGKSAHIGPGCNLAGNVKVGEGTFLGVGSKVIPKITINEWSILGAGSVVINDVPASTTSVGIPSKIIKFHNL